VATHPPSSCPIPNSIGYVPPSGPVDAPLVLVGEAAGHFEAYRGIPFVPDAPGGKKLDELLGYVNIPRSECRIVNVLACHPPRDWLVGAPWESRAVEHCSGQLQAVLAEPHKVIVPLGATALRAVLGLPRSRTKDGVRVEDFHGAPTKDSYGRWVVGSFHPAYLLPGHGGAKFTKTVAFDLTVAKELAAGRWEYDRPDLVIDPEPSWFEDWVDRYIAALRQDPENVLLAADVETRDKGRKSDEGELGREDQSWEILYLNLSCSPDEGITFPWVEPYISIAKRALEAKGVLLFWNGPYDIPRLKKVGIEIDWANVRDMMDAWHVFQSHLPRGLGFVSPHYSRCAPWKHLGNLNGTYRAMDGVQTLRCAYGILRDLKAENMEHIFHRHCYLLDTYALRPAEEIGLPVDKPELVKWRDWVRGVQQEKDIEIQKIVPRELWKEDGPYKKKVEGWVEERGEEHLVLQCETCGAIEVVKKHRCKKEDGKIDKDAVARVTPSKASVKRYYRPPTFNPGSWQQILKYIKWKKHKPGKNRKTGGDSTDKKALERLRRTAGDPFYSLVLERRGADKMAGTYGDSILEKLGEDSRIHATFLHVPSTLRLSCADPNLTNLGHHVKYAPEFRRTIKAAPKCKLMGFDFASIEAVLTGWKCRDPEFIRLAKLGIHAALTGILVGEPASDGWSDADKLAHFRMLKERYADKEYEKAKRVVYGTFYGAVPNTFVQTYPELFPKKREAEKVQGVLFEMLPSLVQFHAAVRKQADQAMFLGGPPRHDTGTVEYMREVLEQGKHPFGYKHYFYDVVRWQKGTGGTWKETLGDDGKRVIAFFPQSIAAGILYEATLRLMVPGEGENWIGDAFYGSTPLRALIHDEALFEVPEEEAERVYRAVMTEMGRPVEQLPCPPEWGLGEHLTVGVAAKVGKNWGAYNAREDRGRVNLEGMVSVTKEQDIAGDEFWPEDEEGEAA